MYRVVLDVVFSTEEIEYETLEEAEEKVAEELGLWEASGAHVVPVHSRRPGRVATYEVTPYGSRTGDVYIEKIGD